MFDKLRETLRIQTSLLVDRRSQRLRYFLLLLAEIMNYSKEENVASIYGKLSNILTLFNKYLIISGRRIDEILMLYNNIDENTKAFGGRSLESILSDLCRLEANQASYPGFNTADSEQLRLAAALLVWLDKQVKYWQAVLQDKNFPARSLVDLASED